MKLYLKPTLEIKDSAAGGGSIDLALVMQILKDITEGRTLMATAARSKINYRNLIDLLTRLESALEVKIVERVKGHGTLLTNSGDKLLSFLEAKSAELMQKSRAYQDGLLQEMHSLKEGVQSKWVFYSSSDPIIQATVASLPGIDLKIAGSGESLDRLLSGDADIAGYHVSTESDSRVIYKRLVKNGIEIFPVMKRTQGLITKKGNPLGIKTIHDLCNPKIRFINRQIGSGTRLLLDTMLLQEDIEPLSINGYLQEEYTHSAVATAILANKVDVGLGVKNVAIEEGLGFVPIKDEIFFLAMKEGVLSEAIISRLIRKIRKSSSETAGYKSVGLNRQINEWIS
jgi:molybdate-binding protein/molybdenum-dependent DNA-binding transcriptional regulator ModE